MPMNPQEAGVLNAVVQSALPGIIGLIKGMHSASNPSATPVTDADVIKTLATTAVNSIAVDEAWKAAHQG